MTFLRNCAKIVARGKSERTVYTMALTKEDLQAIAQLINPINERLNKIEERLDTIEENTEITRGAVNSIIQWVDTYWRNDFDKPFPPREKDIV